MLSRLVLITREPNHVGSGHVNSSGRTNWIGWQCFLVSFYVFRLLHSFHFSGTSLFLDNVAGMFSD